MSALKLLFISACCLLTGSACLGAFMSGPAFIFAAPIVALFGWFYIVPIFVFVTIVGTVWKSLGFMSTPCGLDAMLCGCGKRVYANLRCARPGARLAQGLRCRRIHSGSTRSLLGYCYETRDGPRRSSEWRPRDAVGQFRSHRGAAIGELIHSLPMRAQRAKLKSPSD